MRHRTRWFGIVPGTGEKIPRNGIMRGRDWGWDVKCNCGWATHTGGAIEARVREEVRAHHRDVADGWCVCGHPAYLHRERAARCLEYHCPCETYEEMT